MASAYSDAGFQPTCACNDDCAGAGEVCVLGTRGVLVCCPGSTFEDCPAADPGTGIECVDAGPPVPAPDSGVPAPGRFDAGSTPPSEPPEDESCSASGSISHGAFVGLALALGALASRRRFRR